MRNLSSAQSKYEDFPEEDSIEDEMSAEQEVEQRIEKQEEINVNTVKDFIEVMLLSHDLSENNEEKQKIMEQIIKVKDSLRANNVKSTDIYVEDMEDNVFGKFLLA